MSASVFFIKPREGDAQLRDVASRVFTALGVSEWEERHSANYPPDQHYFAGYCENKQLTVYEGDGGPSDYAFRISLEDSSWRKGPGSIPTDPKSVAKALVGCGFVVLVPDPGWERADWDGSGDVYEP